MSFYLSAGEWRHSMVNCIKIIRSLLEISAILAMPAAIPAFAATQSDNAAGLVRVNALAYHLQTASQGLCKSPILITGVMLHDLGAYGKAERPGIAAQYGLGNGFGVAQVVAGSPAARAGLKPNDEIVALNGVDVRNFQSGLIRQKASYDRVEAFTSFLREGLTAGHVVLDVKRGEAQVQVDLAGQPACGGRAFLVHSDVLNAWSDGKYVAITDRMYALAEDDSELAFVLAHEMAHIILGHEQQLRESSKLFAELGLGGGKFKRAEIEADVMAVRIMMSAGLDMSAPERFLRRAAGLRPFDLATTHPGISRRIRIVNDTMAEIEAARIASAQPVLASAAEHELHGAPRPPASKRAR